MGGETEVTGSGFRSGAARRSPVGDGPRERLGRLGASALTDAELLALLLGTGAKGRSVHQVAEALLCTGGSLKALLAQDAHELAGMAGLGPARAAALLAAVELGKRAQRFVEKRPRLLTPEQVHGYLAPTLCGLRREEFHVLSFNARNVLLHDARVAQGTVGSCPVDPREIFAGALAVRASGIVLAHNHPSGDPEPSQDDLVLTGHVARGARLLGIRLLDHVVVGDGGFVSFVQRRLIQGDQEVRGWRAAGELG